MARNRQSEWDLACEYLNAQRCRFRIYKRERTTLIWVREVRRGQTIERFAARPYRHDRDEDIERVMQLCMKSHKAGKWLGEDPAEAGKPMTWERFARLVRNNLRERIEREGSRANAEGHLKTIETWEGTVSAARLLEWGCEIDPLAQPSAFRNRIETISHIQKAADSTGMDVSKVLAKLRAMRPQGARRKQMKARRAEVHAIPSDPALQRWLDQLDGMEQWTFALIATYGLRPSEAWHAERIDDEGWLVIPGDGKTKTGRRIVPPLPRAWLARYRLADGFETHQKALNARWKIQWSDSDPPIPVNNSRVSNALWRLVYKGGVQKLMVGDEWVRPYDLRHSYAIRCFTHEEVMGQDNRDFAMWMGHSLEVHESVYLKYMSSTRKDDALKDRFDFKEARSLEPANNIKTATEVTVSDDIQKRLEKLEKLEKMFALMMSENDA